MSTHIPATTTPNAADLDPLSKAIRELNGHRTTGGVARIGRACDVSAAAVRRWRRDGRLPRTELIDPALGGTDYASRIASLPEVTVTKEELLEWSRRGWARN